MQLVPKPQDEKLRLFVDPASISSGWALFKGKKLVSHGTIKTDKKGKIFARLRNIFAAYVALSTDLPDVDEVHIETMPRRVNYFCIWSVAVIGLALSYKIPVVKDDVPVRAWQKAMNWNPEVSEALQVFHKTESEDEAVAICLGNYWLGVNT